MKLQERNYLLLRVFVFFLYAAFIVAQMCHHEYWRDEVHSWNIVICSDSLQQLWSNVHYEGHPFGWYFILYLGKLVYSNIISQRIIHLFFTFGTAYLLLFRSPFKLWLVILLLFGVYFGYEYSILERNYSAAIFFLFLSIEPLSKGKYSALIPIIIAMFINVHAFILGSLCIFYLLLQKRKKSKDALIIITAYLIISALFFIDIYPTGEDVDFHYDLPLNLTTLLHDINQFNHALFWTSSISKKLNINLASVNLVFITAFITASLFLFRSKKEILIIWLLGVVGLLLFWFLFFMPGQRHFGHVWVFLLLCSWLFLKQDKDARVHYFLLPFAIFQLYAAYKIVAYDYQYPVSQIENVSAYLRSTPKDKYAVVGYEDCCTEPIACLSNRTINYPQLPEPSSFVYWTTKRLSAMSPAELLAYCKALHRQTHKAVLLISIFPIELEPLVLQQKFYHPKSREEENYYVYLFNPQ